MSTIRKHIKFYGSVQGVSFRYTSSTIAKKLGLTGWVRNEYDGSVEMEAQGTSELINKLIDTMKNVSQYIAIDNIEQKVIPVVKDEKEFIITY